MITPEEKLWMAVAATFIADARDDIMQAISLSEIEIKTDKWIRWSNDEWFNEILSISNIHSRLARSAVIQISLEAKTSLHRRHQSISALVDQKEALTP